MKSTNFACPASRFTTSTIRLLRRKRVCTGPSTCWGSPQRTGQKSCSVDQRVYGDPRVSPQPGDLLGNVNPIGPRACYDEAKRCAETLFFTIMRRIRLDQKVGTASFSIPYGRACTQTTGASYRTSSYSPDGNPITIYATARRPVPSATWTIDRRLHEVSWKTPVLIKPRPDHLGNPRQFTILELANT